MIHVPRILTESRTTPIIYVCSPLKGDIPGNTAKAREYCRAVVEKGYIPFAPHVFFTQFLDENNPEEREIGIRLGTQFIQRMNPQTDELWAFGSIISAGMQAEIDAAVNHGITVRRVQYSSGKR